jgi:hypothetical protein
LGNWKGQNPKLLTFGLQSAFQNWFLMSEEKVVIFERGSFELGVTKKLQPEALAMLKKMTVGSSGAQYLHKDI